MSVRTEVLRGAWLTAWALAACARAGGGGAPSSCPPPQGGLYATFRMPATPPPLERPAEEFHVSLTSPGGIASALDAWQGRTAAQIPSGAVVCAPAEWNCGWMWHFDPSAVEVVEVAMELCDGAPPQDAAACQFILDNGGRLCPWGAQLVALRDCRADATCPAVPR